MFMCIMKISNSRNDILDFDIRDIKSEVQEFNLDFMFSEIIEF